MSATRLSPCPRCGGPRSPETYLQTEILACLQCGQVSLNRADLDRLAKGRGGLTRTPTIAPDERADDEQITARAPGPPPATPPGPAIPGTPAPLPTPDEVEKAKGLRFFTSPDLTGATVPPPDPSSGLPYTRLDRVPVPWSQIKQGQPSNPPDGNSPHAAVPTTGAPEPTAGALPPASGAAAAPPETPASGASAPRPPSFDATGLLSLGAVTLPATATPGSAARTTAAPTPEAAFPGDFGPRMPTDEVPTTAFADGHVGDGAPYISAPILLEDPTSGSVPRSLAPAAVPPRPNDPTPLLPFEHTDEQTSDGFPGSWGQKISMVPPESRPSIAPITPRSMPGLDAVPRAEVSADFADSPALGAEPTESTRITMIPPPPSAASRPPAPGAASNPPAANPPAAAPPSNPPLQGASELNDGPALGDFAKFRGDDAFADEFAQRAEEAPTTLDPAWNDTDEVERPPARIPSIAPAKELQEDLFDDVAGPRKGPSTLMIAGMVVAGFGVLVVGATLFLAWGALRPAPVERSTAEALAAAATPEAPGVVSEPAAPAPTAAPPPPAPAAPPEAPAAPSPEVATVTPPAPPAPKPAEPAKAPPKPAPKASPAKELAAQGWKAVGIDDAKAIGLFAQALDADPNHADASYGMGYSQARTGNMGEARRHLCDARRNGGSDVKREVDSLLNKYGLSCS